MWCTDERRPERKLRPQLYPEIFGALCVHNSIAAAREGVNVYLVFAVFLLKFACKADIMLIS